MDFFEDELVQKKYDWKLLLEEYMFSGKNPLINGLVSGRAFNPTSPDPMTNCAQSDTR